MSLTAILKMTGWRIAGVDPPYSSLGILFSRGGGEVGRKAAGRKRYCHIVIMSGAQMRLSKPVASSRTYFFPSYKGDVSIN